MADTPMNRRALLIALPLAAAAIALAGCTTTTTGSVTVVTLDVARVTAFAQAGLDAAATVGELVAQASGAAAATTPLAAAATTLSDALARFAAAAGAQITVRYDDADVATAVDSLLSALQSIAALIDAALAAPATTGLAADIVSRIKLAYDALETIVATFRALLPTATAMRTGAAPRLAMSEARALALLARAET